LFALFSLAPAHGVHKRRAPAPEELAREEIRAREHAVIAKNCEPQIRENVAMRMRKRAEVQERIGSIHTASPEHPYSTHTTCLTAPEVLEGPYYINNELVRLDVRENQEGVILLMDFGIFDTTTCTPMDNAFVEIWQANATGEYGGYNSRVFDGTETWLRGGWHTDANGIVELATIYPGYYAGRTAHIHLMVHRDWIESENGTLISHSGTLLHTAQIFFDESWNDEVYQALPYILNTNKRTLNSQDRFIAQAQRNGYNPFVRLAYLNGRDLSDGLVGYITVGVDSRSHYMIKNTHYNG